MCPDLGVHTVDWGYDLLVFIEAYDEKFVWPIETDWTQPFGVFSHLKYPDFPFVGDGIKEDDVPHLVRGMDDDLFAVIGVATQVRKVGLGMGGWLQHGTHKCA